MYRSQNKRVRLEGNGVGYELFFIPENAQHIIDRENDPSHQVTLDDVYRMAQVAHFVPRTRYRSPHPHVKAAGYVKKGNKYFQILAYFTSTPAKRCIVETCHVVKDIDIRRWCDQHPELVPSV